MDKAEQEATGVTRSRNIVHTLPYDASSMAEVLAPALALIDGLAGAVQLLVITPDAETAMAMAAAARRLQGARDLVILPLTSPARGLRMLRRRPASAVLAAPAQLLAAMQSSALKLDGLRLVILAWPEELGDATVMAALESVMGEVPKDAARTLVTSVVTPPVEEIAERYLRRAHRLGETSHVESGEALRDIAIRYATIAPAARPAVLHRLLDELDPERTVVFARSDESEDAIRSVLALLGYAPDSDMIRIRRPDGSAMATQTEAPAYNGPSLVILYDCPATQGELVGILGDDQLADPVLVALVQPRQLRALRSIAGGGQLSPLVPSAPLAAARAREERIRAELRQALVSGPPARELLAIEPLLADFDGAEIAAAALRLLERERSRPRAESAPAGAGTVQHTAAVGAGAPWARVFVNVGSRDGIGAGDVTGAILGEAGIARGQIGKIDVRESHTTVEVAAPAVAAVVTGLTGKSIKGRRAVARLDQERGSRSLRPS
ncbi:MAG: DbpA RNA binding domain-containing protein, partial [Gemmatimonadaceae bacterium]